MFQSGADWPAAWTSYRHGRCWYGLLQGCNWPDPGMCISHILTVLTAFSQPICFKSFAVDCLLAMVWSDQMCQWPVLQMQCACVADCSYCLSSMLSLVCMAWHGMQRHLPIDVHQYKCTTIFEPCEQLLGCLYLRQHFGDDAWTVPGYGFWLGVHYDFLAGSRRVCCGHWKT